MVKSRPIDAEDKAMTTLRSRHVRAMVTLLEAQAYEIRCLQRAIRHLEGRLQVLVGLDALVADQLRAPVAAIQHGLEELGARADTGCQALVDEGLAQVRCAYDVIAQLVEPQQLSPVAVERARVVTVPLDGLVEQALTLLATTLDRSRVAVDLPAGLMITTAPRRLVAVLINLFENAAHHGGDGPIECKAQALGDGLAIEVSDRGPGLGGNPEALFQPAKADEDGDQQEGGTGLYLVRMLARSLGGDATVADRPGGGTSARVTLPQGREEEACPAPSHLYSPAEPRS